MAEYTMEQFRAFNVARQFGAEQAAAHLTTTIEVFAREAGESWLTDPRRAALEHAQSVLRSYAGGRDLLDDESLAQLDALNAMALDRDKRLARRTG